MKKKKIYIILLLLMSINFLIINVNASDDFELNFGGYSNYDQIDEGWIVSSSTSNFHYATDGFYIFNGGDHGTDGSNGKFIQINIQDSNRDGWFNITNDFEFGTLTFYHKITHNGGSNSQKNSMVFNENDGDLICMLNCSHSVATDNVTWILYTNETEYPIYDLKITAETGVWFKFEIMRRADNRVRVRVWNETDTLLCSPDVETGSSWSNWNNSIFFDEPFVTGAITGANYFCIDDLSFTQSYTYYDGTYNEGSSLIASCDTEYGSVSTSGSQMSFGSAETVPGYTTVFKPRFPYVLSGTIEYQYNAPSKSVMWLLYFYDRVINATINRVDLQISQQMIEDGFTRENFQAKLNQYDLGCPDNLTQISSKWYIISWIDIECKIVQSRVRIAINHDYPENVFGTSWDIGFMPFGDIDNDGDSEVVVNTDPVFWNNFNTVYMTNPTFLQTSDFINDGDLMIRFCTECEIQPGESSNYENDFLVTPTEVTQYDPVDILYRINDTAMGLSKYIKIYDDDFNLVKTYPIIDSDNSFKYTPTEYGTYTFNLTINNISIMTQTVEVTEFSTSTNRCSIYVDPSPSRPNQGIDIHYYYNYTEYPGRVYIIDENDNIFYDFSIETNERKIFSYRLPEGCYNILLAQNRTSYYTVVDDFKHYVRDNTENWLKTTAENNIVEVKKGFEFYGSHSHRCENVYIDIQYFSNIDVSDSTNFQKVYAFSKLGDFYCQLILELPNGKLIELTEPIVITVVGAGQVYKPQSEKVEEYSYVSVFGFVTALCIGILAGYVAGGTAFAGGFFGSMIFFSIPNHPFSILPIEILFIFSLMMILYIFVLIRR